MYIRQAHALHEMNCQQVTITTIAVQCVCVYHARSIEMRMYMYFKNKN